MTLANMCNGTLEDAFQSIYPEILAKCMSGEKGSISIIIELERVEDTATVVRTAFSIKSKAPAFKKMALCTMTGEYQLNTEEPDKPQIIDMFKPTIVKAEGGQQN
jgi:hypothetical protein